MIGAEPGIAERDQRENDESRDEEATRRAFSRSKCHQQTERHREVVSIALLETERARQDFQHELEEPRPRECSGTDEGHGQRRGEGFFFAAGRGGGFHGGVEGHFKRLRLAAGLSQRRNLGPSCCRDGGHHTAVLWPMGSVQGAPG